MNDEVNELGEVTAWGALMRLAAANKLTVSTYQTPPTGGVYVTLSDARGTEPDPRIAMAAEDTERAAELLLQRIWRTAWENTGADGLELPRQRVAA